MNLKLIIYILMWALKSVPRKYSRANRGKNHKSVPVLLSQQFLDHLNRMLNTTIKDARNFIRILLSSMKKFYLQNIHD